MRLNIICEKLHNTNAHFDPEIEIESLVFDSRKITRACLFFAIRGVHSDGHLFIQEALNQGAAAIVCEHMPEGSDPKLFIVVADSSLALAIAASAFYNNPSKSINLIGITGTNGKTTSVTLLHQLFNSLGKPAGLISTVRYIVGDEVIAASHTTPDPIRINQMLRAMVDNGCEYCFMEVSSHAMVQNRVAGLTFKGGIFSNITHDHLDFHKTFAEYIKAKQSFFSMLPSNGFALINLDDPNGKVMVQHCSAKVYGYSLTKNAEYKSKVLENHLGGLLMNVNGREVWFRLAGRFNAYNLTAIYATACLLNEDPDEVLAHLSKLIMVDGRFELIQGSRNITGIVDYAHTPDALKNVLETIRELRTGNETLITVVGAGGDRDRSKRPIMAKVSVHFSDRVILTSDNPRTEDPIEILKEMKAGIDPVEMKKVLEIPDRREAIKTACLLARDGDIILIAGKGHETYQEINGVRYPFDDREILKENLNQ